MTIFNSLYRGVVLLTTVLLLFNNCANESVPQGGKQDTEPPKAEKISPPNKTTGFKSDVVKIRFNEFLKETGFSQTLISPPLEKKPIINSTGKTITVKIKSVLRDSTTYTINFADDIKDLNEGNPAPNFTYVFSTGTYIDSQRVSGSVLLASNNQPQESIVVSLYPKDTLDGILKSKPFYFTKTDKAGNFAIENIKSGKYWVFALKDQNYNYIYDQPNELIAFCDTAIDLTDTINKSIGLVLFEENKRNLKLNEVRSVKPGKIQISYSKPVTLFKLNASLYSANDFAYTNTLKDTITYWYTNLYQKYDTLYLSANDTILDTTRIELKFIEKDSLGKTNTGLLSIENQGNSSIRGKTNTQNTNSCGLYEPFKLNLSNPILEISNSKRVQLKEDSTLNEVEIKYELDELTKQALMIDFKKKENTNYIIEIPDSTLKDIFGFWNKKISYKFSTNSKDNYGNIKLTLKTSHPEKHYVVRLLNANEELVKEIYFTGDGERKIHLENIPAGGYKFVVIDDENKNGNWDTGDLLNKKQPEKIFTYKETYQLKGNWDLDAVVVF